MTETLKPLPECKRWLADLKLHNDGDTEDLCNSILAHIDALEKREDAAKETLRFYANEENVSSYPDIPGKAFEKGEGSAVASFGIKARDTLRMMEDL